MFYFLYLVAKFPPTKLFCTAWRRKPGVWWYCPGQLSGHVQVQLKLTYIFKAMRLVLRQVVHSYMDLKYNSNRSYVFLETWLTRIWWASCGWPPSAARRSWLSRLMMMRECFPVRFSLKCHCIRILLTFECFWSTVVFLKVCRPICRQGYNRALNRLWGA